MQTVEVSELQHPHWKVKVESPLPPDELAAAILQAWRHFREASGIKTNFIILALGGRKDGAANPNSLLQPGAWGVDVVETEDSAEFLKAVNWNNLKEGRPLDAVFEIYNHPQ